MSPLASLSMKTSQLGFMRVEDLKHSSAQQWGEAVSSMLHQRQLSASRPSHKNSLERRTALPSTAETVRLQTVHTRCQLAELCFLQAVRLQQCQVPEASSSVQCSKESALALKYRAALWAASTARDMLACIN